MEHIRKPTSVQRKCACGTIGDQGGQCTTCAAKQTDLQRSSLQQHPYSPLPPPVKKTLSNGGTPLEPPTRDLMESRFNHDFSQVRVHNDATATQAAHHLDASAFTQGQNIYFAAGRYRPDTTFGRQLLAHELTHTIQQRLHHPSVPAHALQSDPVVSQPGDGQEREADAMANQVMMGHSIPAGTISSRAPGQQSVIARQSPATASPTVQAENSPSLSIEQIQSRLQLMQRVIERLMARYRSEEKVIGKLQAGLQWINEYRTYLSARTATTYTISVTLGQTILDRAEKVLTQLDMQHEAFEKRPEFEASRKGYITEVDRVRELYFEAIAMLLAPQENAKLAFNHAEIAAEGLPRALLNQDLAHLEHGGPPYKASVQQELYEWVEWVRTKLDALDVSAKELRTARQKQARDLQERETRFTEQTELIKLSIEGMGQWDNALMAFKKLAEQGNIILGAYKDIGTLVSRCRKMKEAAYANNLQELRRRTEALRNDPDVARFYKALPLFVFGSRFAVSFGIILAASIATAGVGGVIAGAIGTPTTLAGAALATGGTIAVEALTFTLVSRGLQSVLPGQAPTNSFWQDLAFNLVLFGTLRGMSQATKFGLSTIGLEALQGPVQMAVSYPIVHYLGILEFRLTQGRWLTSAEIESMDAQNLIMMAGLALGMGIVQRYLPSEVKTSMLATFLKKYGMRFEALEAARQKLLVDLADLADQGRANDTAAVDALKKRAQVIEDEFKKLVGEVEADKAIDLKAIRAELKKAGAAVLEGSAELLRKGLGLPEDVGLQRAGGDRQFTYKWGKTNDLETRLRDIGAQVIKEADPQTGLRTLTARFQGGDPLTFQERPTPYPGTKEVNVDPTDPIVQKLMADFKISDPAAQRFILRMLTVELAKNPNHGLASAASPVRTQLKNMQAKGQDSVENQLLDLRQKGTVGSKAPPALIARTEKLIDAGILSRQEWLSARTHEEMEGLVGEMLAYLETLGSTVVTGQLLLRNVQFIGSLFKDAALTVPYRTGTDIVPELDLLTTTKVGANFEYSSLSNVKVADVGKSAKRALSDAQAQNQQALAALRAHARKSVVTVTTRQGETIYGYITKITAVDPLGQTIDLTGHLTEASAGATAETIGPKGNQAGFTKTVPYTYKEISTLVDLLREAQLKRSKDY